MSCFLLSEKHFRKLREETIYFLRENTGAKYKSSVTYYMSERDLQNYVDCEIRKLIDNNIVTIIERHNESCTYDERKIFYNTVFGCPVKDKMFYKMSEQALVSLYQAYKCTNYQIEINYDMTFINWIMYAIADKIAEIVVNHNEGRDDVCIWGYDE